MAGLPGTPLRALGQYTPKELESYVQTLLRRAQEAKTAGNKTLWGDYVAEAGKIEKHLANRADSAGEQTISKAKLDQKLRDGAWEVVWEPDRNGRFTYRVASTGKEHTAKLEGAGRSDSADPIATRLDAIDAGLTLLDSRVEAAERDCAARRMDAVKKPAGWWLEVNGRYFPMTNDSDASIDAAIKKAGLWKKGKEYPDFSYGRGEEEHGGGGGRNSGYMDEARADAEPRTLSEYKREIEKERAKYDQLMDRVYKESGLNNPRFSEARKAAPPDLVAQFEASSSRHDRLQYEAVNAGFAWRSGNLLFWNQRGPSKKKTSW